MVSSLAIAAFLCATVFRPELAANAAEIDIETCADWEAAVEATLTENTLATIVTSSAFFGDDCGDGSFKTLEIKNKRLTVVAPSLSEVDYPQFFSMRFSLSEGGQLTMTPSVEFNFSSDDGLEVDGGFLQVAEGSKARFLGNLQVYGYKIQSYPEDGSDFAQDFWEGGCVWNQGYFRVDGYAEFLRCDNTGGGESPPGRGGAIFNGETGSILFRGGVRIEETYLTDDEGNNGAGIHNLGKVNIKADSIFKELVSDTSEGSGGAIYNVEGAKFTFRKKATATFVDDKAARGGAVFNAGNFKFSGPALFTLCSNSAVFNVSPGNMELSDGSVFWKNSAFESDYGGAVTNRFGGTIHIPEDVTFVSNTVTSDPVCDDVYLEQDDEDNFTCYP